MLPLSVTQVISPKEVSKENFVEVKAAVKEEYRGKIEEFYDTQKEADVGEIFYSLMQQIRLESLEQHARVQQLFEANDAELYEIIRNYQLV